MKYELSIVIPLLNEEKNIQMLYTKLKDLLKRNKIKHEIIFIDDGSTDNSFNELKILHNKDKDVKIIQFTKNFGKSAALNAGFKIALGGIIITMDADLQDDPEEIPNFIKKINEGYDLVGGWRYKREDCFSKRLSSNFFNLLVVLFTGARVHDNNCGFKAYKQPVAKNLNIYGELHRFIPVLAKWKGYKSGEIKIKHYPRAYGRSKYGFSRLLYGFLDLITIKFLTTYLKKPAHLFGVVGLVFCFIGSLFGFYLTRLWYRGVIIWNRPLLIFTALLIITGVQFISFGLLAEMLVSGREKGEYVIKDIIGCHGRKNFKYNQGEH